MAGIKNMTPAAKQCLELEVLHPDGSTQRLADEVHRSRQQVYNGLSSPCYIIEREKILRTNFRIAAKIAQDKMIEMAQAGDFNACKYILDYFGYKQSDKLDIVNEVKFINVKVDDSSKIVEATSAEVIDAEVE